MVIPVYAAVLSFIFVRLSMRVIQLRRGGRVALGHDQQPDLERAIRAHGNFAEYVPLALLLLFFGETLGFPKILLHVLGTVLIAGRLSHAYGLSQVKENFRFRVGGMVATFAVLNVTSIGLLIVSFLR